MIGRTGLAPWEFELEACTFLEAWTFSRTISGVRLCWSSKNLKDLKFPPPGSLPTRCARSSQRYRGTSPIRNSAPLGPYCRTSPRALWKPYGGVLFLTSEIPPYSTRALWSFLSSLNLLKRITSPLEARVDLVATVDWKMQPPTTLP